MVKYWLSWIGLCVVAIANTRSLQLPGTNQRHSENKLPAGTICGCHSLQGAHWNEHWKVLYTLPHQNTSSSSACHANYAKFLLQSGRLTEKEKQEALRIAKWTSEFVKNLENDLLINMKTWGSQKGMANIIQGNANSTAKGFNLSHISVGSERHWGHVKGADQSHGIWGYQENGSGTGGNGSKILTEGEANEMWTLMTGKHPEFKIDTDVKIGGAIPPSNNTKKMEYRLSEINF